jgi:hypothetical protein
MSKTLKNKPAHSAPPKPSTHKSRRKRSVGEDSIAVGDQQQLFRKLHHRLRQAARSIERDSGGHSLWRQFESILKEYCSRRDEVAFGMGFRQGFTAAQNTSLRVVASSTTKRPPHHCPDLLRVVAIQSDQPTCARVASLLETIAAAIKPAPSAGPNVGQTSPRRNTRLTANQSPQRRKGAERPRPVPRATPSERKST